MKINPILTIFLFILIGSCNSSTDQSSDALEQDEAVLLSAAGSNATNPFLTKNHLGHPALCWTEELPEGEGFVVKYAVFDPDEAAFGDIITVEPSKGTAVHPENMNKIAFRSDGTVVAVYSRKHPTAENRFAGSILYTQSFDGGKTWAEEAYLHSDTSRNVGRGYFDLATLADGEVGAIWLDGRYGKASKGSALFFAKTVDHEGFGEDKDIGESTCECCRTDLYVDKEDRLNIVYRDILNDSIRDIVHQYSGDNGASFSNPRRISHDNWVIHGCPHTGASLASNSKGLHAVWFTAGGAPGVYFTSTENQGQTFSVRNKISDKAMHPQMAALPDDRLVLVWDEVTDEAAVPMQAGIHQGGHSASAKRSSIILQVRRGASVLDRLVVSDPEANATYPVLVTRNGKILVAWSQESDAGAAIHYRWMSLEK
jgi:hypothetical protein